MNFDKKGKSRLLIVLSYAVVIGVAVSMIYFSDRALYRPLAELLHLTGGWARIGLLQKPGFWWLGAASAAAFVAAVAAFFLRSKPLTFCFIALGGVLLGAARYFSAVDLSDPHHISHYLSRSYDDTVILRGTVTTDPDYRERFVNLMIQPEEIVPDPSKPDQKIVLSGKTGSVLAKVYPLVGDYYWTVSYGDRVELHMPLMETRDLTNPAGFNYGRYLRARDVFATSPPWGVRHPGHIRYLGPGHVNFLVTLSLRLKVHLLQTIRRTMPYPESAFLGGVTLGLRAGLPQKIKMQFQTTGVSHVLAVSGLHVGFVHALLLMICRVFKVPRRASYFVIVFGLVVFMIITGSSPATQRSVLMSSIGQAIFTFGGFGIMGSTRLTIPIAGLVLLLLNPTIAPDGSFVLSIVAVWSLAHLSDPVDRMIRLVSTGWRLAVVIGFMFLWTGIAVLAPDAYNGPGGWLALAGFLAGGFALSYWLDRRWPLQGFDFFLLPRWLTGLTSAQGAILLGMTFPLSAVYFQRYSISGTYANFIAIPLIGFIVQLGLLAGLLDLIFSTVGFPGVGTFIALSIDAGNWYLCKFFLAMTAFYSKHFPYPYLPMPSWRQLIYFYIIVLGFVFWEPLVKGAERLLKWASTPSKRWALGAAFALALLVPATRTAFSDLTGRLQLVFFDSGYGNAVLIRTPRGRAILIDGGSPGRGGWGTGETIIAPALAKFNIAKLDAVVLTCMRAVNGGGLPFIMQHFQIGSVYSPVDPKYLSPRMNEEQYLAAIGDAYLYKNPHDPEAHESFTVLHDLLSTEAFSKKLKAVKAGDVVFEEKDGAKTLTIRAVWPPPVPLRHTSDDTGNNSVVLKLTYGDVSFLLATQLSQEGEWALIDAAGAQLKADWLLVPSNGNPRASSPEFIQQVGPKVAVIQYGYVGRRDRRRFHASPESIVEVADRYRRRGIAVYRLDQSGAVIVNSDGRAVETETILPYDPARSSNAASQPVGETDRDTEIKL